MTDNRTTDRVDHSLRVRDAIDELMHKKDATDNRTTELLPCPHCGKVDTLELSTRRELEDCPNFDDCEAETCGRGFCDMYDNWDCIVCSVYKNGCGASGGYGECPAKAIEKWNTRTPEQAIAATLGNDASAVRLAERLRGIADEMRNMGASTMTPHELFRYFAREIDKAVDIAATLGSERELIDLAHSAWSMALCAMNGMPIPAEWGDAVERGLREHGINVDGESAAFEVIDDER